MMLVCDECGDEPGVHLLAYWGDEGAVFCDSCAADYWNGDGTLYRVPVPGGAIWMGA